MRAYNNGLQCLPLVIMRRPLTNPFAEKTSQHDECTCRAYERSEGRDEKPLHAIRKTTQRSERGMANKWRNRCNACGAGMMSNSKSPGVASLTHSYPKRQPAPAGFREFLSSIIKVLEDSCRSDHNYGCG